MPEITAVQLGILAVFLTAGVVLGWFLRSDRCAREKIALNAGWQEQLEGGREENDHLLTQNKGLMQQINQYQAAHADATRCAKELADALKEAVERRDELQQQMRDIRGNLEAAIEQKNRLQTEMQSRDVRSEATVNELREKNDKIFRLSRELSSWQNRVPPLVERFRERDRDAKELQVELAAARDRIVELEVERTSDQTRIEPVDRGRLADGLDASNDQYDETLEHRLESLEDQVVADWYRPGGDGGGSGMFENEGYGQKMGDWSSPVRTLYSDSSPSAEPPYDGIASKGRADADELQLIRGVGPAIENTLHELGIFRFEQIAQISEYDIDRIAERLKGFRSRIYREDWIGQARNLQIQKDGEPS